jgi:hypothetical protein
MIKYLLSYFWSNEEKISLCPNSFSIMPCNRFHNFAIMRVEPDED